MGESKDRYCARCRAPLSRFNTEQKCSACARLKVLQVEDGFWEDPHVLSAVSAWDMGAVVSLFREHTGASQSAVARQVNIDQAEVSRLEKGRKQLRDRRRFLHWAGALGMPEELIGLLPPPGARTGPSSIEPARRQARRTGPSAPSAAKRTLSESVVHEFALSLERMLSELAASDNLFGPRHTVPLALAQMRQVEELLESARGDQRARILRLAARYAEFLGWLHQDLRSHQQAVAWSDRAIALARDAGDSLMTAYVLMRKSNIASEERDSAQAAALAAASAKASRDQSPGLKALILRQEAAAAALAGDEVSCLGLLDQAAERAGEQVGWDGEAADEQAALAGYCSPAYVESERAHWWVALGHSARAVGFYEDQVASWPDRYYRDKGLYLARLALAYVTTGEPEQACQVGSEAWEIAQRTGSARTEQKVLELCQSLGGWASLPQVKQFNRDVGADVRGRLDA